MGKVSACTGSSAASNLLVVVPNEAREQQVLCINKPLCPVRLPLFFSPAAAFSLLYTYFLLLLFCFALHPPVVSVLREDICCAASASPQLFPTATALILTVRTARALSFQVRRQPWSLAVFGTADLAHWMVLRLQSLSL